MKNLLFFLGFFLAINTHSAAQHLKSLEWIQGTWEGASSEGSFVENWTKVSDELFLGEGYFVQKGDTIVREILRMERIGPYWNFISIINENYPVLFTLIRSDHNTLVFQNEEHDFPQRIVYSFKGKNNMLAWIEGEEDGKSKKEEYAFTRLRP